ncbi:unnamed protein product, partial [Polarella glacialis]
MILALAWCAFVGIHAVPAAASTRLDPHCLLQSKAQLLPSQLVEEFFQPAHRQTQRSSSPWGRVEVEDNASAGFFEFYTFSPQGLEAIFKEPSARIANALTKDWNL